MLQITMPLAKCQYSRAGPDPKAVYHHSSTLRKWVLSSAVGNELVIECTVLGNSADEEGSSARLAHQFAEHVRVASSGKPPQVIPPRGNAKNVGIVESGRKRDVGAETPRYMRAWREV